MGAFGATTGRRIQRSDPNQ